MAHQHWQAAAGEEDQTLRQCCGVVCAMFMSPSLSRRQSGNGGHHHHLATPVRSARRTCGGNGRTMEDELDLIVSSPTEEVAASLGLNNNEGFEEGAGTTPSDLVREINVDRECSIAKAKGILHPPSDSF